MKNSEGSSQVQFRVNVLSPPTKPEGPLEATNVTAEGCTLNWKPPVNQIYRRINSYNLFLSCRKMMVVMI
jgi:hypothetical protein